MWGVHGHFQEMALVDWDLSKQILSLILKCVHLFSLKGSKNFIKMIFRLFGITLFSKSIALNLFYTMADRILLEMGVFVEGEPMVDCDTTPNKSGASPLFTPGLAFSVSRLDEQLGAIPTRTMHFEKHWRLLESMKAQYVAGNGFRKVSCVVSIHKFFNDWELQEEVTLDL